MAAAATSSSDADSATSSTVDLHELCEKPKGDSKPTTESTSAATPLDASSSISLSTDGSQPPTRHPNQKYIGRRLFYPTYTSEAKSTVLSSDRVKTLIRTLAIRKRDELLLANPKKKAPALDTVQKEMEKRAQSILNNLVTEMHSATFIRTAAFTLKNILSRMYNQGIHIKENEVHEVKKWALFAEQRKMSMLFLPCHKSHIDYIVISYLFYKLGISLPAIAAGENLDIPIVGSILKKLGAWYIKRGNWSADPMYVGLVKEYLEYLLNSGQNIEFFIEGERSEKARDRTLFCDC